MRLDGLEKIARTTWFEAAASTRAAKPQKKWRQRPLVNPYAGADEHFHDFKTPALPAKPNHSSRSAWNVAEAAARRGATTITNPHLSKGRLIRNISRRRRRILLRSTAPPVLRDVTTPKRAGKLPPPARQPTTMNRPCHMRPFSRTEANSERRDKRAGFGKVSEPIKPGK